MTLGPRIKSDGRRFENGGIRTLRVHSPAVAKRRVSCDV